VTNLSEASFLALWFHIVWQLMT